MKITEENVFPQYQYSRFDSKNGQYVVRSDSQEDFEKKIAFLNGKIDGVKEPELKPRYQETAKPDVRQPYKESAGVTVDQAIDSHICPAHNIQMISKVSKTTNKQYWSHGDRVEGKFIICFGKGWAK